VDEVPDQQVLCERAERERCEDFRQHDKEVKDAHINTHPLQRKSACEDGIRHREDARSRHAAQGKREQQQMFLLFAMDEADGNFATNFADLFFVTNVVDTATNYLDNGAATNWPARYYRVRLVQ
jgi:hypothetical protein